MPDSAPLIRKLEVTIPAAIAGPRPRRPLRGASSFTPEADINVE